MLCQLNQPHNPGLWASWSWKGGVGVTLLRLSHKHLTLKQPFSSPPHPTPSLLPELHPTLLLDCTICFMRFTTSGLYPTPIPSLPPPQIDFYIPVYFPEGLGCHDLKPIGSDLHPCSSRIRPTCSLCALPIERTAVSSTPSAPCLDVEKTRFLRDSTVPSLPPWDPPYGRISRRPQRLSRFVSLLHLPSFKVTQANILLVQIGRSSVSKSTCSLSVGVPEVFTPRRSQTLDTIRGQTASLAVVLKPDYRCLRANLSRSV